MHLNNDFGIDDLLLFIILLLFIETFLLPEGRFILCRFAHYIPALHIKCASGCNKHYELRTMSLHCKN